MVRCSLADFGCLAASVLQAGVSLQFQARGGSMTPVIRDGDTVLVSPVCARDLRVGEIVLSQTANEKFVVHRILRRRRQQDCLFFLLKGDLCHSPDGWVDGSRILGRAIEVRRQGRVARLHGGRQRLWGPLAAAFSSRNVFNSLLVLWLVRARARVRRARISSPGAA